jgi:AcrR family transcriptional regulator
MTSLTEKEPTRRGGRGARRRILAAAAQLFYYEGINATAVDLISERASVSKRTLYLHKRDYIDGLTALARAAGAADPEMLGNQIALLYEGASGLSTSLNDAAPWARARATAEALMDRA